MVTSLHAGQKQRKQLTKPRTVHSVFCSNSESQVHRTERSALSGTEQGGEKGDFCTPSIEANPETVRC